jgi:putative phosphoribosyl transferase
MLPFADRRTAGRLLAEDLKGLITERTVVLGLPRGGVAVGHEVAGMLDVPFDVIVTRKIGYPPQPELGVGAIAEGGAGPVFDDEMLQRLGLTPADLGGVLAVEEAELARRVRVYRGDRPPPDVSGRDVMVVDDGLATGVTARAALRSLRAAGAGPNVLAVPVAPPSAAETMREEADLVVILVTPRRFSSVGEWYTSFGQLSDADVLALLESPR